MTNFQALILGIVQGITEFLPVSSSGHVLLVQKLWHISGNHLLFITFLHIGTLVAVLWAFRKEIQWLYHHPWSHAAKMIYVALVPTAILGIAFEDLFETIFSSASTLAAEFVITGVVLWWMDALPTGLKSEDDMDAADALWVGTLQGIAILPALSRSGLTIATGIWRGLDKEAAGRFSFLLSIPAILGATLVQGEEVLEAHSWAHSSLTWQVLVIGTIAAAIAGYVAIFFTLWLLRKSRMRYFAVYTWLLAAFILADELFFHQWFPPLF